MVGHLGHLALSGSEAFDDRADEVFRDVDGEELGGLHELAIDALGDDHGARDHQLEAFAAHHFDEHGELELAAAEDLEVVGGAGVFDADGDVGQELALKAFLDVARGDELAFAASERAVVDGEDDGDGGLVDGDEREGLGVFERAEGFADGDAGDAGDGDDVANFGVVGVCRA